MGIVLSKGYENQASVWHSTNSSADYWAEKNVRLIERTGYFLEHKNWYHVVYKRFQYLDRQGP